MPLALYNSLTRRKEAFVPLDPQDVRLYVCGPTVYDSAHIGNARAVVVFDVLYRVLRHQYGPGHVRYVRNITDVEDKIIDAARANGEPIAALTQRTTAAFHADMAALATLPPDVEPRATDHIAAMIAMIERLVTSGHAYAAQSHVLFAIASYAEYGRLSGRSRDEMIAGARVEVAPYKRDPGDFVLWKPSNPDQPGWDSPWGRGRPGWHIECSAMSAAHLGEHFDIHGGGIDLIFPHHENEIAQSVCVHGGRPFVNLWMHNGFLSVDGQKMSKSLGNFRTVRDLLGQWPGEVIRLALLGTHYRDPLDWTEDKLRQAKQSLDRWYRALDGVDVADPVTPVPENVAAALADDMNTPLAIVQLHELAGALNRASDQAARAATAAALLAGGRQLGVLGDAPAHWLQGHFELGVIDSAEAGDRVDAVVTNPGVDERIAARTEARRQRQFREADRIRDELAAEGIVLEDHPDRPTTWRRG